MPIYAYRCSSCGHAQDVLQKLSDPVLHTCPTCGAETFVKQVTAAGFQLKGSGWYVTDFRDQGAAGSKKTAAEGGAEGGADKAGDKTAGKPADKSGEGASTPAADSAAKPAAAAPASSGAGAGAGVTGASTTAGK